MKGKEIDILDNVHAIAIPDGDPAILEKGTKITIHQELGGSFTVMDEYGMMFRINGKDAHVIDEPVPESAKDIDPSSDKPINDLVYEQLRTVYDPEIPVNVVDLGLIYNIDINKCHDELEHFKIDVEMTLTAPGCGMGQVLQDDVKERLQKIPTVKLVHIELVFDPPWDRDMMTEEAKLHLGLL